MPTFSISIPAEVAGDVRQAITQLYGSAVDGLTPKQQLAYHLRMSLTPYIKAIRQARIDRSALEAVRLAVQQNEVNEAKSVKVLEQAALAQAETDIGGIS